MRRVFALFLLVCFMWITACGDEQSPPVANDFDIEVSAPRFVIPSDALPAPVVAQNSNNNVDITFFEGRLFLAWRSAPTHFASTETRMYIISSPDSGAHWEFEHEIHIGTDMREPRLLAFNSFLQLMFFEAGTNAAAFEPKRVWRARRLGAANWTGLEPVTDQPEIPWDLKVRNGRAYLTSYQGDHYGAGAVSDIRVFFKSSLDGNTFNLVDGKPFVYRGGVSEVAFEFDSDGSLWAVTRNEDGDDTGFGAHVCHSPASALAEWTCSEHSDPERYDSPEMFRHGDDIYLVARRDIGGPFDEGLSELSFLEQKFQYLLDYSLRPKRTALYRIDKEHAAVEHLFDLPGDGDTAFASVQQTGPDSYLLANYTSPLGQPDITWLEGQNSGLGTQIYLLDLNFVPRAAGQPAATPTITPVQPPTPTATPRGGEAALHVDIAPVFARPGTPFSVTWPSDGGLEGTLTFDSGFTFGPETTAHAVGSDEELLRGSGFVRAAGTFVPLSGTIVRADVLGVTGLRRFTLVEPSDATAQGVIRTVIPAFYWAAIEADTLAIATDATGQNKLDWTKVTTTPLDIASDGAFSTGSVDFDVELTGAGARPSGQFVGLVGAHFTGRIENQQFVSPITMTAEIVVADVVNVLKVLGSFPEEQAVQFVAGVFHFDPAHPPATSVFRGELAVVPLP